MIITLTLTLDDAVSSQIVQDAALAIGVTGSTDAECVDHLKAKIRADLRALVIRGTEMRKRAEAEAAAQAAITASVAVG
jgi:hypothetical protein